MKPMKNNISPFYVGQKVVCVEAAHGLVKDQIYTVHQYKTCTCGSVSVLVEEMKYSGSVFGLTTTCCHKPIKDKPFLEFLPSRFAPLQQQNFPLMTFSQIQVKEVEEILINN